MRSPRSGVGSILSTPRPLTSIRWFGVSISSFIRSGRLVPPAMNYPPGRFAGERAQRGVRARRGWIYRRDTEGTEIRSGKSLIRLNSKLVSEVLLCFSKIKLVDQVVFGNVALLEFAD